jgi:hypothetical protein
LFSLTLYLLAGLLFTVAAAGVFILVASEDEQSLFHDLKDLAYFLFSCLLGVVFWPFWLALLLWFVALAVHEVGLIRPRRMAIR